MNGRTTGSKNIRRQESKQSEKIPDLGTALKIRKKEDEVFPNKGTEGDWIFASTVNVSRGTVLKDRRVRSRKVWATDHRIVKSRVIREQNQIPLRAMCRSEKSNVKTRRNRNLFGVAKAETERIKSTR